MKQRLFRDAFDPNKVIRPTMVPDRTEAQANNGTAVTMIETDFNKPPEPEYDPPVVDEKADWKDENVYEVGQTIEGRTATYTGGTPDCKFRSRIQTRATAEDSWENTPWQNHSGTEHTYLTKELESIGQCRLQTQARDEGFEPTAQVNSFASVKTVTDPAAEG